MMNEHIKDIALRLKGLRDVLEVDKGEFAQACSVSEEQYEAYESGEVDIPVGVLYSISKHYNIEVNALLFGDEPRMASYFVTRRGTGAAIERSKAYSYQSLAAGFAHRKASPFLVKVAPNESRDVAVNSHEGQEFIMVLSGKMLVKIDGRELTLEQGDSIYFDSMRAHGFKALDNMELTFLSIII